MFTRRVQSIVKFSASIVPFSRLVKAETPVYIRGGVVMPKEGFEPS